MNEPALQRYQVMEPLGRGSQAELYRGVDRETGRSVAIKILSLDKVEGWKGFELFEREIKTLMRLEHPRIPRYLDNYASEESGHYFLVMDLVEGQSLDQFIGASNKGVERSQLEDWLLQAFDILEYLHDRSPVVVHRDLKPSNLILDPQGKLHLIDFGGVKAALGRHGGSTMIGTFGYMAPEQLRGEANAATDIYALGATMAALAAGQEASDLPHDSLKLQLDGFLSASPLRSLLSEMLEPDPKARPQTISDCRIRYKALQLGKGAGPRVGRTAERRGASVGSGPEQVRPRETESALARLEPSQVKELATLPKPLSIPVWLFSSLSAGAFVIVQAVILPLVYRVLTLSMAQRDEEAKAKLRMDMERAKRSMEQDRKTLSAVAELTHPLRDSNSG